MTSKIGKLNALWLVEKSCATFSTNQRGETFSHAEGVHSFKLFIDPSDWVTWYARDVFSAGDIAMCRKKR